jgi:hypothetical protein
MSPLWAVMSNIAFLVETFFGLLALWVATFVHGYVAASCVAPMEECPYVLDARPTIPPPYKAHRH